MSSPCATPASASVPLVRFVGSSPLAPHLPPFPPPWCAIGWSTIASPRPRETLRILIAPSTDIGDSHLRFDGGFTYAAIGALVPDEHGPRGLPGPIKAAM